MKTLIAVLVAAMLTACAQPMTIDGVRHEPCGLINERECKDPNVVYDISMGNVFWSIALSETIVAPLLLCGWQLYEPIGPKHVSK